MKRKVLTLIICFMLLISLLPQTIVFASTTIVASGTCGDNLTWTLDDEGTLTISGSGEMWEYSSTYPDYAPWSSSQSMRDSICKIVIEDDVTTVGNNAFCFCLNVTNVTIGNGVMSIGNSAFERCKSLYDIELSDGISNIGAMAFKDCTNLTIVKLNNELESIGGYAFSECKNIKEIIIPDSVTDIGNHAFYGCTSLENIKIGKGITNITNYAFRGCTALVEIIFPDGITSIDEFAFYDCTGLEKITLPEGMTSITESAFYGCTSLESVRIPKGVISIDGSVFKKCTSLSRIVVDENNLNYCSVDGVLLNKQKTEIIIYPSGKKEASYDVPLGIKTIKENSFSGCTNIEEVTISNGVINIEDYAFSGCLNIKTIRIPKSVECIGYAAFDGNYPIKTVYYLGDKESWGKISVGKYNYRLTAAQKIFNYIGVEGVSIEKNVVLHLAEQFRFIAVIYPSDVTNKNVLWFSSNENVATVNNDGVVTTVGAGETTIIVTTEDGGYSAECKVTVLDTPISYSFGQSVQIGLIEPWFLKANARVYTDTHPTNIDYSSLVDYGAYFIRASALSDENATQESLAVEDIINNPASSKYSKSAGTATVDGSYITANYDKGLYTYELDDSVFVLFYIEDANGITYAPIRERNLKSLLEARCNDVANFPNELERAVYKNMLAMFDAISAYRDDYFSKN